MNFCTEFSKAQVLPCGIVKPACCLNLVPTWVFKFVAGLSPNFIAQNLLAGTPKFRRLSPKMKGDEPAMKYQKVLIFIAGSSLFICDLMIKVSNIKEIPPILTIDLKFLFKIQMELFIRKTSPRGFLT